jgi:hypothetical protein
MAVETWLETQFRRTNLPRSGLADYLGVDNAAISRAAADKRRLVGDEILRAAAYFSVVPTGSPDDFTKAVRRLRSPDIRARATAALASWLRQRKTPPGTGAAAELLASVMQGKANLRVDQIIAVARSLGLRLAALVQGDAQPDERALPEGGPADGRSMADRLAAAARGWVAPGGAVYDFARGPLLFRAERAGEAPPASYVDVVSLREPESDGFMIERCKPYLVPDDSLSPRFEQGETLFLEPSKRDVRRGDYVAALLSVKAGRADALIGRLRLDSKHAVVIEPPRGGPREVDKSKIVSLHRIAFCAL